MNREDKNERIKAIEKYYKDKRESRIKRTELQKKIYKRPLSDRETIDIRREEEEFISQELFDIAKAENVKNEDDPKEVNEFSNTYNLNQLRYLTSLLEGTVADTYKKMCDIEDLQRGTVRMLNAIFIIGCVALVLLVLKYFNFF